MEQGQKPVQCQAAYELSFSLYLNNVIRFFWGNDSFRTSLTERVSCWREEGTLFTTVYTCSKSWSKESVRNSVVPKKTFSDALAVGTGTLVGDTCNTPTYCDLAKAAKDVFNKGYGYVMVKIDLRTKSYSGVKFSTSGHACADKRKASGNVETKYRICGLTFTQKWNRQKSLGRISWLKRWNWLLIPYLYRTQGRRVGNWRPRINGIVSILAVMLM